MLKEKRSYYSTNIKDFRKNFNDGVCEVFTAIDRELTGSKGRFFFSNETLAMNRLIEMGYQGYKISKVIGIPVNSNLDGDDVIKIDGKYYLCSGIQRKNDKNPNYFKVALKESEFDFNDRYLPATVSD